MCEFCHRHGEGKKWYLAADNYAEELFTEASRQSVRDVLGNLSAAPPTASGDASAFQAIPPLLSPLVRWVARRHQQDVHWGQVVPLEDAHALLDMLDWVVRLPCTCRATTIGDKSARYCFGIGVSGLEEPWRKIMREAIDPSLSVETLTREQAKAALTDLDRRGAMHSVWTFKTPFIGGICNCDQDCNAYRAQMRQSFQVMFRAEYVARIDPDKCSGCRLCMQQCLFGALSHSLSQGKCSVNALACYGCGVCRATCKREAIALMPRAEVPAAAGLWNL
jgi:Pyruvate/2-oxoacid:ferredoxin oxidoreductase delta subunit